MANTCVNLESYYPRSTRFLWGRVTLKCKLKTFMLVDLIIGTIALDVISTAVRLMNVLYNGHLQHRIFGVGTFAFYGLNTSRKSWSLSHAVGSLSASAQP